MAELSDLPLTVRAFMKAYRWRRIDPVPWSPLAKPLSECRLALVSSAGFVLPDQEPFDDAVRGGDSSLREIPSESAVSDLIETHRSKSFDHAGLTQDPNVAFPLDRARELVTAGRVASLARAHLSCMGSITATGGLVRDTAPAMARALVQDEVDIALLVPV